jgi:hypothetical protein
MKYRIRKTNEIVDVVGHSVCTYTRLPATDYVCYIDNKGEEIVGRGLNLIWDFEPILEEYSFDWQSFRAEAAKDILCAVLPRVEIIDGDIQQSIKNTISNSINVADELIKQLKENKEK